MTTTSLTITLYPQFIQLQTNWEKRPRQQRKYICNKVLGWTEVYIGDHFDSENLTTEELQARKLERDKYIKPEKQPLYSLQTESLKAYCSSVNNSRISDKTLYLRAYYSIYQESAYHQVILEDNQPIPRNFSDLRQFKTNYIEQLIQEHYTNWIKAGGYQEFILREGPRFYFNLWNIVEEQIKFPTWYTPEVKEHPFIEEGALGEQHQPGGELHQHHQL